MSSRLTYATAGGVLADKVIEWGGENAAIDFFVTHIVGGGSIPEFCEMHGLHWGLLAAWIRNDPDRNARYTQAMIDRSALRKERLLDGWWATAEAEVRQEVTHGDVHKAREALAKAEGMFKDTQQTNVGVVIKFDAVDARA